FDFARTSTRATRASLGSAPECRLPASTRRIALGTDATTGESRWTAREGFRAAGRKRGSVSDTGERLDGGLVSGEQVDRAREGGARLPLVTRDGEKVALQRGELGLVGELDGRFDLALRLGELLTDDRRLLLLVGLHRFREGLQRSIVVGIRRREAPDGLGLLE